MSWPIPTFRKIELPAPIALRVWLPALTAMALGMAGAVLLLWPHGKSTHGLQFWGLLIGIPLVTCVIALGVRLDRWEHEQTIAEEAQREQERIMSLWRSWSRRQVCVEASVAILPIHVPAAKLGDVDADLPVNMGRASAFDWSKNKALELRRAKLLGQIADALRTPLTSRKEMRVRLLLADASAESLRDWKAAAQDALGKIAPDCKFSVDIERAGDCASFLTQQVDLVGAAPQLIIAAQLWPDDETKQTFSEGAAALLIEPAGGRAGHVFRPMTAAANTLEAALQQLVHMQISPDRITHTWFTRCEAESGAITSALISDPKARLIERHFDHITGEPGPATSWIALATALEASHDSGPQVVAWREPDDESLHLCMVGAAEPHASQKEF
ncbi:hypothetical protein WI72_07405 [Burkholderia ubonensis]|uniref:hypothetical protein n=1 Tax=Burkholderia ubonensis TaxID=101571 RepID=UPI000755331A|nr:hypothetical protein [Burkholderia ubonensis]KVC64268.1 hypothetical protein WI72_07405 [Burkholderia ubonensis]KVD95506.1 hypothetical protein WI90_04880 [Burkholderia ubonensis]